MTDQTAGRLAAALETPDESDTAGRRIFLVILWLAAGIGLFAHVTDGASTGRIAGAVGLFLALAVWLHLVHRVQIWQRDVSAQRLTFMLIGVYAALIALLLLGPAYLIMLFGVYSLTFGFVTQPRLAAGLSFVVTIIWIGAWLFHDLPTGAIVTPILVWGTLVTIANVLDRVSAQSQDRRDLLAEIHETRAQLAQAQRQAGVLAERQRVAAEIHDTLAQGYTSIVLLSQAMGAQADSLSTQAMTEKLALVEQTARENLTASRRLVEDLQPIELETGSLVDAIQHVAQKHQAATGTDVQVHVAGQTRPLGGTLDVAVLRSIQEALANARKHADADHIMIELNYRPNAIDVCVTDDGVGFDPGQPAAEVAGVVGGRGLAMTAERMQALGGTSTIESSAGAGTTVRIFAPTSGADSQAST